MKSLFLLLAVCLISDFTTTAFMNPRCPPVSGTTTLFMNEKKKTPKKRSGGGFGGALRNLSGSVRPGKQSPQRVVLDESIVKPDYWKTGKPLLGSETMLPWVIEVKTEAEIEKMRKAGKLAREILDLAGRAVSPGVTTDHIDTLVHNAIVEVRRKGYQTRIESYWLIALVVVLVVSNPFLLRYYSSAEPTRLLSTTMAFPSRAAHR
jgi:hypothetical protein